MNEAIFVIGTATFPGFGMRSPSVSDFKFLEVDGLRGDLGDATGFLEGDEGDRELLKATVPHVPKKRVPWKNGQKYFPGRRPPALDAVPWVRKLKPYLIPSTLESTLRETPQDELTEAIRTKHAPRTFNANTHNEHFKVLLWAEEWRME